MRTAKVIAVALVFCFGLFVPGAALAWDKVTSGRILKIETGNNGVVAIMLEGVPNLCNSSSQPAWAIAEPAWGLVTMDGTKMILSVAMSAYLAGKNVTLYANNNPGVWGCKLGLITIG